MFIAAVLIVGGSENNPNVRHLVNGVGIIVEVCKFTKSHWIAHLEQVNFTVYKWYLNKVKVP